MHPGIDVSIAKLCAPVEVLKIDRRACRILQRAHVYTVAEVLLRGKPTLCSFKQLGSLTVDRIWQAVAAYLELPEEQLAGEAASPTGSRSGVWETPVSALPLRASTAHALARLGYLKIDDLVKARANQYRNLPGVEAHELFEIDQRLHRYLARAAQAALLWGAGGDTNLQSPVAPPPVFQLPMLPKHSGPFWNTEPCS
jgi:DNA-directed RNA polymerase alpha subunit